MMLGHRVTTAPPPAPLPPGISSCCCGPKPDARSTRHGPEPATQVSAAGSATARPERLVRVPGGRALVGTRSPLLALDGEGPLREVRIRPFAIDPYAVTNDWFASFVAATSYVTEAERFGWSFVFFGLLPEAAAPTEGVVGAVWWRRVEDACWKAPEGPGSDLAGRGSHPVVHVSLNDARAFAAWAGARLPTEVEWEHAARGGLGDVRYPWGDREPEEQAFLPANIWQGSFPERNTAADGWIGTCPVDAFAPNGYGLYNMCGNVWEWCDQHLRIRSNKRQMREADANAVARGLMLAKGGSHLCHHSYCHRYRIAARTGNTADSATSHMGFRVVYDLPAEDGVLG